ncbi:SDR family NAD(P)-dependent oxidoreductase [Novosphingobium bradum]|uniref:SDR family NAD(P)-dependent oxidoreductase n=1 Tax=Novosphingobium bradum TaxID=1737444 RepID=A0ABV7IJD4_9SPHN
MAESDKPVAIVTGAARGIGRSHALALAQAGYAVVVNDLGGEGNGTGADLTPAEEVVAEIKAMGGTAIVDGSDVSNWEAAGGIVRKAIDTFGRLDALVNNAGVLRDRMLANMTEADWDIALNVNLKGSAAMMHHAAAWWRDRSKETGAPVNAAVVNTTSGSSMYYTPGQTNYSAAKAGVTALTIIASRELARYGVRVNAIAPIAATRLTAGVMPAGGEERLNPAKVSPLVVYLLSPEATVTGRAFHVGADGFFVYDTPRPLAGRKAEGGDWTTADIARVMPAVLEGLPEPATSAATLGFMNTVPVEQLG